MSPDEEREYKKILCENYRLRNRIRKLEHQHQEDIAEMASLRRYVDFLMESQDLPKRKDVD